MTVRLFNERRTVIASGPYQQVRERIISAGGHFTTTCYIASKTGKTLEIAAVQFKGAALSEWMEFKRKNRKALYEQAIQIKGFKEGRKGAIKYRVPVFHLKPVSAETNAAALDLDKQLQEYLTGYFARATKPVPQAARVSQDGSDGPEDYELPPDIEPTNDEPVGDEYPF